MRLVERAVGVRNRARRILARIERRISPRRRLIAIHHRLDGRTGHRFQEALGLMTEAPRRGLEPLLFIHRDAQPEVRAALPAARAVLHDPVFSAGVSFDARTREFVDMLHRNIDADVLRDDLVLMTTATQCEARAFAAWVAELPARRKPWVAILFHSDRWNRHGAAERDRQVAEFRVAAGGLAALSPGDAARLAFFASTPGLADELSGLLGVRVDAVPIPLVHDWVVTAPAPAGVPRIGFLGGCRAEKGSHRTRAIIEACRGRGGVRFLVQLANEQLPADIWADLEGLAGEPEVEIVRGGLAPQDYAAAIAACSLLLLPYERICYRHRSSAILVDAAAAGRPVVVPDGTWLSAQVEAGRAAGVVYHGDDVGVIADAVAGCVDRLPELAARARARAESWRRRDSLAAFLDHVETRLPPSTT